MTGWKSMKNWVGHMSYWGRHVADSVPPSHPKFELFLSLKNARSFNKFLCNDGWCVAHDWHWVFKANQCVIKSIVEDMCGAPWMRVHGAAKYSFGFVHPLFRILSISREWPWYVISILLQEIKPQVVPVIWRYRSRCIDICSERCDFLKNLSTSMSDGCCVYPSIIVQSVLMIKMWLISIMK